MDWKPLTVIAVILFLMPLIDPGLPLNVFFAIGGSLLIAGLVMYVRQRFQTRHLPAEIKMLERTRASAENYELASAIFKTLGVGLIILGFIFIGTQRWGITKGGLYVFLGLPYVLQGLFLIGVGFGAVLVSVFMTEEARHARARQVLTYARVSALVECPKCHNQYTKLLIEKCPNCGEPNPEFRDIWKTKKGSHST